VSRANSKEKPLSNLHFDKKFIWTTPDLIPSMSNVAKCVPSEPLSLTYALSH